MQMVICAVMRIKQGKGIECDGGTGGLFKQVIREGLREVVTS